GGYPITVGGLTGAKAKDYTLDPVVAAGAGVTNGTLTITPAPLTVIADDLTKIIGEANPTFTVHYTGFVLGQGPGVLGGTLTFITSATTGSLPGLYAITPGGLTSGNYAISFVSGTLTVLTPGQAMINLLAQVNAASVPAGIQNSLASQ